MSKLLPALQKFYNALRHLEQFSLESSFFDNIGALDVFLSEFRSVTFVLQKSLGGNQDPVYHNNLSEYLLRDVRVAEWLNEQRTNVVHKYPLFSYMHGEMHLSLSALIRLLKMKSQ